MGTRSTHMITRETAMAIVNYILATASDDTLSNILDTAVDSHLHNFSIVSQTQLDENKKSDYPLPYVEKISDLPI